tara:strand:- start:337 stop:1875 length:1539 start_codon:yes stop_codon:yes gene_type:complete
MADPWSIKKGVYDLTIKGKKDKSNLIDSLTATVQSNLNAGRPYNHGIEGVKIDGKPFRIGGLGTDKQKIQGTHITLKPIPPKGVPDPRTVRTTIPDSQFESRVFFKQLEDVNNLNKRLKLPKGDPNKITSDVWLSKLKSLVRKNKLQLPGMRPGQWDLGAWNKSLYGLSSKLPDEFFSKANYEKFMRKNYAVAQKVAAEMKRLTGIEFDAGHPQAGGANIGLTAQLRYHASRGNQTIKGILPKFKDIVKSATDDVWGPGQLRTAGIPFDHVDGMYSYLNQYLPDDKTIKFEDFPEAVKESILFNKKYAVDPAAAIDKALLEQADDAIRQVNLKASQPPRVPPATTNLKGDVLAVQRGKRGLGNVYKNTGGINLKSIKNLLNANPLLKRSIKIGAAVGKGTLSNVGKASAGIDPLMLPGNIHGAITKADIPGKIISGYKAAENTLGTLAISSRLRPTVGTPAALLTIGSVVGEMQAGGAKWMRELGVHNRASPFGTATNFPVNPFMSTEQQNK